MHIDTLIQEYVVIRDKMRKAQEIEQDLRSKWFNEDDYLTNKAIMKIRKSWLSQLDIVSNLSQKANKAKRLITEELDNLPSS